MAIFRLLHASDLHIARKQERVGLSDLRKAGLRFPRDRKKVARASSYSPDLLDGLIEFVYARGGRYDVVLISGDLATTGKDEDLAQALASLDGDAAGLWYSSPPAGRPEVASHRALQGSGSAIALLPGNHDRFQGPLYLPGGAGFDRHFGAYWQVGQGVQGWLSPPKAGARLGLVAADLTLRSGDWAADPLGSYGLGSAHAGTVAALEALTDELRADEPGLGLLWVVHFPPAYPKIDPMLRLLDEQALLDAADRLGVRTILSGHTHRPRVYRAFSTGGRPVTVLCAGSATQWASPAGHFIHELAVEATSARTTVVGLQTFRWEDSVGALGPGQAPGWVPVNCP